MQKVVDFTDSMIIRPAHVSQQDFNSPPVMSDIRSKLKSGDQDMGTDKAVVVVGATSVSGGTEVKFYQP